MLIFQGLVKVSGSSIVASYRRWFGEVGVYRSVTFSLSLWWLPARSNHDLVVEAGDDDDERLALPAADRLAHPGIDGRGTRVLQKMLRTAPAYSYAMKNWLWLWKIWNG